MREVLLSLTIDVPPIAKGRPRFASGHAYTPKRTRMYEERVAWLLRQAGARPAEGLLGIELVFHTRRAADLDNLLKAFLDAGIGVLYSDDAQIKKVLAEICSDSPSRTDVLLYRLTPNDTN